MASVACVLKKATSGGGARNSIYEIYVRDSVSGVHNKVAELHLNQAAYDALAAGEKTEFNDAGNTLTAIRSVTDYGVVTDL